MIVFNTELVRKRLTQALRIVPVFAALVAVSSATLPVVWSKPCPPPFVDLLRSEPIDPIVDGYEATRVLSLRPTKDISTFQPQTGIRVTARDAAGKATEGTIRVLVDNPNQKIYAVGEWNAWGAKATEADRLTQVAGTPYYEGKLRNIKHGMQYRLSVNGKTLLDPAAEAFSTPSLLGKLTGKQEDFLNSVFWDFDHPGLYKPKNKIVDLRDTHVTMGETEIRALVEEFPNPAGGIGPAKEADTYEFIASSGVIPKLKEMGYNAIEFLPFNMSQDAKAWQFRYQVYGGFAPDSRFGTPTDFAKMVDAFNREGISVVMDAVVGHYPQGGNTGLRALESVGLHNWKKADGRSLFGEALSPWGTHRYDYENPFVRRHLVDGLMTMVKRHKIGGIRFDNLDGIRGMPGGEQFLRELHEEIRAYAPEVWTNAEMFFGENKVTASMSKGGLGVNSRTHSDLFDWFKERALGGTESFDMYDLRARVRTPVEEWREAARTHYITSHDEAANGRNGFTGQYVAEMLAPGGDWWVQRKTQAFNTFVMVTGPASMDMPQVRLLQRGNFSHNPAVKWSLLNNPTSAKTNQYFTDLSKYLNENKAFNFRNMRTNVENHTDNASKVMSILRTDGKKKIYTIFNFNHVGFDNYAFGVDGLGDYRVVLNADATKYGGSGTLEARTGGKPLPSRAEGMHGKSNSIAIPHLAPMSVVVLELK